MGSRGHVWWVWIFAFILLCFCWFILRALFYPSYRYKWDSPDNEILEILLCTRFMSWGKKPQSTPESIGLEATKLWRQPSYKSSFSDLEQLLNIQRVFNMHYTEGKVPLSLFPDSWNPIKTLWNKNSLAKNPSLNA